MKVTVRLRREKQTQIYECPCGNIYGIIGMKFHEIIYTNKVNVWFYMRELVLKG